jgi:hypothetical protein
MSEKHTLERIRQTRKEKEAFEKTRKDNYKSPSAFVIMSRFMKDRNKKIIEEFSLENNLSQDKQEILIDKFHKLNYYTPVVTAFIKKEESQFE